MLDSFGCYKNNLGFNTLHHILASSCSKCGTDELSLRLIFNAYRSMQQTAYETFYRTHLD